MHTPSKHLGLIDEALPGHTLPQAFYCDPQIYDIDVSAVFTQSWLMAGFESEIPDPGSYIALTIGGNPIIVLRTRVGEIAGYHNTCRHRGSQILANGCGRVPKLVCPYHKWTYELDGRLLAAPRMEAGFSFANAGLKPISVRTVAGCVYVALTDKAPEFAPFASTVDQYLEAFDLRETKIAYQSTLIEKANWKLVMENARECYHCATGHPELKISFPVTINAGFDFGKSEHVEAFLAKAAKLALPVAPREGDWWSVGRYPLNPGMESISQDGRPVVARRITHLQEQGIGGVRWATEPNNFCHALPDYAFMFSAIPIGTQETMVISKWLVHKDAVEGIDYKVDELIEIWTATNLQDRDLAENNQRGVNGLGYSPGKYSEAGEDFVIRFNNWYRAAARRAMT